MNKKVLIIIVSIIVAVVVVAALIIGGILIVKNISDKKEDKAENENLTSDTTENSTEENNNIEENEIKNEETNKEDNKKEENKNMYSSGTHHATIAIKDYGTIKLELYADIAPITVANFAKLVNEGFYDGLTFHRIMDGFMMQGGDPEGNGMGGSDETIKGEFAVNGINNNLSHTRGVISMARASYSFDSASSQFFIMHQDATYLDGHMLLLERLHLEWM